MTNLKQEREGNELDSAEEGAEYIQKMSKTTLQTLWGIVSRFVRERRGIISKDLTQGPFV